MRHNGVIRRASRRQGFRAPYPANAPAPAPHRRRPPGPRASGHRRRARRRRPRRGDASHHRAVAGRARRGACRPYARHHRRGLRNGARRDAPRAHGGESGVRRARPVDAAGARIAAARGGDRGAERRVGRSPRRDREPPCDPHDAPAGRPGAAAPGPDAARRLVVLVHGLCMDDLQWRGADTITAPRWRAISAARAVPSLQQRPPRLAERPRFRGAAGAARGWLAGAGR